jgi:hypothetical protein
MGHYRAYVIGSDGHFIKAVDIDCPDDKAATEQAKLLVEGNAVELWQRGRIIGQIDGKRA